jgi:hypothetical protein
MLLKRVFDNAQGRKPRGRCYGVCLELGIDDVIGSNIFELTASAVDTCECCFRDATVAVAQGCRLFSTVEAIEDCQPRSGG